MSALAIQMRLHHLDWLHTHEKAEAERLCLKGTTTVNKACSTLCLYSLNASLPPSADLLASHGRELLQ